MAQRIEADFGNVVEGEGDVMPVPSRYLRAWNVGMGVAHTALLVVTLTVGNLGLKAPIYGTNLTFVDDHVRNSADTPRFLLVPEYVEVGSLSLTWLVGGFFACSALAHLGNAFLWKTRYERDLVECRGTIRWIEYSVSAPIMILLIAYASGVREYMLLFAVVVLVATTMFFGFLCEQLARPRTLTRWQEDSSFVRLMPHALGYVPQVAAWSVIFVGLYDERGDVAPDFVCMPSSGVKRRSSSRSDSCSSCSSAARRGTTRKEKLLTRFCHSFPRRRSASSS